MTAVTEEERNSTCRRSSNPPKLLCRISNQRLQKPVELAYAFSRSVGRNMRHKKWPVGPLSLSFAAAVLTAMIGGCTTTGSRTPVQITSQTETWLKNYLERIGPIGSGAFAISADGRYSYYTYCLDTICNGSWMIQHALLGCERASKSDCVLLANSRNILRPYQVVGGGVSTGETTPTSEPKPVPNAVAHPKKELTAAALSGETLRGHVIGNTFSGIDDEGTHWLVYFDVGQRAKARAEDRPLMGAWQISGDKLCLDFAGSLDDWCVAIKGDDEAADVYRDGKFRYSMKSPATILGNPWKL